MRDAEKRVHCGRHGNAAATFVCVHLRDGVGCGFHCAATPDDPWPDAWCDMCQRAFDREGAWVESNEPPISLLCSGCYEAARSRNSYIPKPLEPGQTSVSEAEYQALADACCERAKVRQAQAVANWGFGGKDRWAYDAESGSMRFFDVGAGGVVADATPVGSYSTKTRTWLWAWDNPTTALSARILVSRVRTFGEVRGIAKLRQARWEAEEVDGWEVSQIAADFLEAEAIYRGPVDHLMVFFLLHRLREDTTA